MSLAEPVRLAEEQVAATGAVLARAFANDPFFTYVLSDPVERERLMPPFMTAWTRYGLLFGEVYVTVGPVEACAIWLPPSAVIGRTEERSDRAGLTAVVSTFSDGARARYHAMGQHQGRVREAAPSVPHWHLPFITDTGSPPSSASSRQRASRAGTPSRATATPGTEPPTVRRTAPRSSSAPTISNQGVSAKPPWPHLGGCRA
jgi:hypothetical protein